MTTVLCEYENCNFNDWNEHEGCGVCEKEEIYLSRHSGVYVGCDAAEWMEEPEEE